MRLDSQHVEGRKFRSSSNYIESWHIPELQEALFKKKKKKSGGIASFAVTKQQRQLMKRLEYRFFQTTCHLCPTHVNLILSDKNKHTFRQKPLLIGQQLNKADWRGVIFHSSLPFIPEKKKSFPQYENNVFFFFF